MTSPTPPKHEGWLIALAIALLLLALGFAALGGYYVLSNQISLLSALIFLVPTGLCAFGAFIAAVAINPTLIDKSVDLVGKLVRFGRG